MAQQNPSPTPPKAAAPKPTAADLNFEDMLATAISTIISDDPVSGKILTDESLTIGRRREKKRNRAQPATPSNRNNSLGSGNVSLRLLVD